MRKSFVDQVRVARALCGAGIALIAGGCGGIEDPAWDVARLDGPYGTRLVIRGGHLDEVAQIRIGQGDKSVRIRRYGEAGGIFGAEVWREDAIAFRYPYPAEGDVVLEFGSHAVSLPPFVATYRSRGAIPFHTGTLIATTGGDAPRALVKTSEGFARVTFGEAPLMTPIAFEPTAEVVFADPHATDELRVIVRATSGETFAFVDGDAPAFVPLERSISSTERVFDFSIGANEQSVSLLSTVGSGLARVVHKRPCGLPEGGCGDWQEASRTPVTGLSLASAALLIARDADKPSYSMTCAADGGFLSGAYGTVTVDTSVGTSPLATFKARGDDSVNECRLTAMGPSSALAQFCNLDADTCGGALNFDDCHASLCHGATFDGATWTTLPDVALGGRYYPLGGKVATLVADQERRLALSGVDVLYPARVPGKGVFNALVTLAVRETSRGQPLLFVQQDDELSLAQPR